jgi:LPXTG-motif cell wall-anchored protein
VTASEDGTVRVWDAASGKEIASLASPTFSSTATVAALLTQAAAGKFTPTPTSSALPTTGFAEDVGVPGLFGIALVMILLIFLARRLRTASS